MSFPTRRMSLFVLQFLCYYDNAEMQKGAKMDENEIQIRERLTALESSVKSLHKRVDHIEELVESVQKMTVELQHMRADINKNSEKLDEIEKRPAKLWGTIITAVLSALGGGLAGFLIEKIIGG